MTGPTTPPPADRPAEKPVGGRRRRLAPPGAGGTDAGGRARLPRGPREVLGVLLPVLAVLVLVVLALPLGDPTGARAPRDRAPSTTPVDRVDLVCPGTAGTTATARLLVARAGGLALPSGGSDALRVQQVPGGARDLPLGTVGGTAGAGLTQTSAGRGARVVAGRGTGAPGLVATQVQAGPVAVPCAEPQPELWFTGAGAGGTHASTLVLVNPDAGQAVADVTVHGRSGVVDAPALRGVAVPGRSTRTVDLAEVAPSGADLGLRVVVSRGRLGVAVEDRTTSLADLEPTAEWLSPQTAPVRATTLLGLVPGSGARELAVTNSGADETEVRLRVLTRSGRLTPVGAPEATVLPRSTRVLDLGELLARETRRGAQGLVVLADRPVTAGLRSEVDGDLVTTGGAVSFTDALAPLPAGDGSRLLLGGAARVGSAAVTWLDADGGVLAERAVRLGVDGAVEVDVPARARGVRVVAGRGAAQGAGVIGAVLVRDGRRTTVVPLRPLPTDDLLPRVRPGVP